MNYYFNFITSIIIRSMFGVAFDKIILTVVGSIMVLVPVIILVFIMSHKKNDNEQTKDESEDKNN